MNSKPAASRRNFPEPVFHGPGSDRNDASFIMNLSTASSHILGIRCTSETPGDADRQRNHSGVSRLVRGPVSAVSYRFPSIDGDPFTPRLIAHDRNVYHVFRPYVYDCLNIRGNHARPHPRREIQLLPVIINRKEFPSHDLCTLQSISSSDEIPPCNSISSCTVEADLSAPAPGNRLQGCIHHAAAARTVNVMTSTVLFEVKNASSPVETTP